jgi:hypothetical protein
MDLVVTNSKTIADQWASEIARQLHDEAAQERALAEIRLRVREYENRYGLRSDELHQAIESGRLEESHDVCRWMMDYHVLIRAGDA